MRHVRTILLVVTLVTILFRLCPELMAENHGDAAEQQFGFAEALFQEGDYFRAITEYKRFIFFYPHDNRIDRAGLRIVESYFRAKRYQESVEAAQTFINSFPSSLLVADALYLKAMAEKNQKKYDQALSTLEALIKTTTGELRDRAIYQQGLIAFEKADWKSAIGFFSLVPASSALSPSSRIISQSLEKADQLPQKDPAVAGALAAVLPGAGHLYTDRPRDAAVAFLLNAAFIAGAVQLFRNDDTIAGGIVAFFELGWYVGNIYSAVGSAHKYNERVRSEFIQKLKENSALSLNFEKNMPGFFLKYSFNF
jgi:outer membrane protein assembly factor BamD (BamD/ComL family)